MQTIAIDEFAMPLSGFSSQLAMLLLMEKVDLNLVHTFDKIKQHKLLLRLIVLLPQSVQMQLVLIKL